MQSDAVLPVLPAFPVIPFLGIVVQLGGAALLVGLFVLLRRFVLRRGYFTTWVWAWGASGLATAALAARYIALAGFPVAGGEASAVVRVLSVVHQAAVIVGLVLFVGGTSMYVSGGRPSPLTRATAYVAASLFGAVTVLLTGSGLNAVMAWASLVAIPAMGYCAITLLRLPAPRRSLGNVGTGVVFGLVAGLWVLYAAAFAVSISGAGGPLTESARAAMAFNFHAYASAFLHLMLGYGMVVMLMEDAKREVDDAHAELRISHDELRRSSLFDPLTDSLNRRAFGERVGLEMVRSTFGTVVLADVDDLKVVNDRHGHGVGDRMLRRCADVLRGALRPYDKLYRWGGDEFLLIVPAARATDVLARLGAALAAAPRLPAGRDALSLEVSLGAADYASVDELNAAIDRADQAMYQEKLRRKGPPRTTPESGLPASAVGGRASGSFEVLR
jgi:diguanylate cyclase (GGDEF)-like protein